MDIEMCDKIAILINMDRCSHLPPVNPNVKPGTDELPLRGR
jgi:hypothetical protein